MTQTAEVIRVDGTLMAKITRTEACAKCGACQHGQQEARLYPLPKGEYKEGDLVEISLPDSGAFTASFIAYGIPVIFMVLGLVIGWALNWPDAGQIALALGALAVSFFIIRALEPRIRRSGRFAPSYSCANKENGGHNNGT